MISVGVPRELSSLEGDGTKTNESARLILSSGAL
jgi:hypothetical protein